MRVWKLQNFRTPELSFPVARHSGTIQRLSAAHFHAGQCSPQEQPTLRSRAFHLSSRKQPLSVSRRAATQLRRFECQKSNPCLHRKPQTLRGMFAKGAMHHGPVQISRHPHPRTGPATRSRLGQHVRFRERTTGKEEGGSAVRGT